MHPYFTICLNMSLLLIARPFWVPSFHLFIIHLLLIYLHSYFLSFYHEQRFFRLCEVRFDNLLDNIIFLIICYFEFLTLWLRLNYYTQKMGGIGRMDFTQNNYLAARTIEKMKILGAALELPAKQN